MINYSHSPIVGAVGDRPDLRATNDALSFRKRQWTSVGVREGDSYPRGAWRLVQGISHQPGCKYQNPQNKVIHCADDLLVSYPHEPWWRTRFVSVWQRFAVAGLLVALRIVPRLSRVAFPAIIPESLPRCECLKNESYVHSFSTFVCKSGVDGVLRRFWHWKLYFFGSMWYLIHHTLPEGFASKD